MSHLFRHFPREVDMRKRKVVHSMEELQRYVKATNGADNITTTVYGFRELKGTGKRGEYSTAIVPHFVMDLDYERAKGNRNDRDAGNRCLHEAEILHQHLKGNDIRHAMWFTGGGIHIWVDLAETHYPDGPGMSALMGAGRRIVDKWVREWSLITLDPVVSFRPDRHIRIPNSFNFKRGLWGFPLKSQDLKKDWFDILDQATEPSGGMNVYGTKGMEIEVVKHDPDRPFEAMPREVNMRAYGDYNILPCIARVACEKGGNPPHEARTFLMQFLQDRMRSFIRPPTISSVPNESIKKNICAFIESLEWSDYNEDLTRGYVNHGVDRYYRTPSCRTLYDRGYCLGRCPYYDGSAGV